MPIHLRRSLQYLFSTSGGIFTLLLLVSFALRLYGLQWDQGGLYHPDERQILMTASRLELPSSWNQFLDPEKNHFGGGTFGGDVGPLMTRQSRRGRHHRTGMLSKYSHRKHSKIGFQKFFISVLLHYVNLY